MKFKHDLMKKLLIISFIALFSIQCSTNRSENSDRQTLETQYNVPEFSSDEVNDYAYEILLYFIDLEKEQKEGQEINKEDLAKKVIEFSEKPDSFAREMTTEDVQKLTQWVTQMMNNLILNK